MYEWLSILVWVFVMYMFVRMTIHFLVNGFSSCMFLCEWLPFLLEWIWVMHVSVRINTISFRMDFRHARAVQMTLQTLYMDFRHAHFCAWRKSMYKVWRVICTERAWRKSIQKENVVIRTETCMTTIHSKRNGSHSHRNVHDENPF